MNHPEPKLQRLCVALALAGGLAAGFAAVGQPPAPRPDTPRAGKTAVERTEQRPPCQRGDKEGARRRPPAFEELDLDGDGYLSADEAVEVPPVRMEGFDTLDADGDGLLSKEELPPPGHPQREGARGSESDVRGPEGDRGPREGRRPPRFEDADADGDGQLSPEEAVEVPPVQREGFEALDADGDGYLTREEVPPPPSRREHGAQAKRGAREGGEHWGPQGAPQGHEHAPAR